MNTTHKRIHTHIDLALTVRVVLRESPQHRAHAYLSTKTSTNQPISSSYDAHELPTSTILFLAPTRKLKTFRLAEKI